MGREVKRVPMDFDWPRNKVWHGYLVDRSEYAHVACPDCTKVPEDARGWDCKTCGGDWELDVDRDGKPWVETPVPEGPGFQMWETTSEGSPQSPVFATFDELIEWCAEHATVFADIKAPAEQWRAMLQNGLVGATFVGADGRKIFAC